MGFSPAAQTSAQTGCSCGPAGGQEACRSRGRGGAGYWGAGESLRGGGRGSWCRTAPRAHSHRGWVGGDGALSSRALRSAPPMRERKRQRLLSPVGELRLCRAAPGLALPLSGGAESWHLELPDVHPSAQSPCCPGPHLERNSFTSRPTLRLSYLPTTHFHAHTQLCAFTRGTHAQLIHSQTLIKTERMLERGTPLPLSTLSFHFWLIKLQQQSLSSMHHPLLVNDLQFESDFPLPVPRRPSTLGLNR